MAGELKRIVYKTQQSYRYKSLLYTKKTHIGSWGLTTDLQCA